MFVSLPILLGHFARASLKTHGLASGKSEGKDRFSYELWGFPVKYPLNQSIDWIAWPGNSHEFWSRFRPDPGSNNHLSQVKKHRNSSTFASQFIHLSVYCAIICPTICGIEFMGFCVCVWMFYSLLGCPTGLRSSCWPINFSHLLRMAQFLSNPRDENGWFKTESTNLLDLPLSSICIQATFQMSYIHVLSSGPRLFRDAQLDSPSSTHSWIELWLPLNINGKYQWDTLKRVSENMLYSEV